MVIMMISMIIMTMTNMMATVANDTVVLSVKMRSGEVPSLPALGCDEFEK